jgi:hypothetical protein
MAETETKPTTSTEEGENSDGKAKGAGTQTDKTEEPKEKLLTQAQVNEIVKKRLKEESEKAKRDADERAAEEKGEHQRLATQYKGERDALQAERDALSTERDTLSDALTGLLKAELKTLPENVRELAPSDDPLQLAAWLPKAKKLAGDFAGTTTSTGNPRGPKPTGKTPDDAVDASKKTLQRRGNYVGF